MHLSCFLHPTHQVYGLRCFFTLSLSPSRTYTQVVQFLELHANEIIQHLQEYHQRKEWAHTKLPSRKQAAAENLLFEIFPTAVSALFIEETQ